MSLHKSTIKSILYATMRCLLAIGVLFSSHHVYAQNSEAKKIQPKPFKKAVLMRPDEKNYFWELFEDVMRDVAQDLDIELKSIHAKDDTIKVVQNAMEIASSPDKPDVVFVQVASTSGPQILDIFQAQDIDVVFVNSGMPAWQEEKVGKPLENYENYIGQMLPNDFQNGRKVAEVIYNKALQKNLDIDDEVSALAIAGSQDTRPSDERVRGLKSYVQENLEFDVIAIGQGLWTFETSQKASARLLTRYANVNAVWAVNDETALGVVAAAKEHGLEPGKDFVIGSIDWLPEALELIRKGEIDFSLGGHFMDGAWALIMAYDFKNSGIREKENAFNADSNMQIIDAENVDMMGAKLEKKDWQEIDFKKLTKTHNPEIKQYNFNILEILSDPRYKARD